jgi:hypothetical protein
VGEIMKAALVHSERIWELVSTHGERMIEENFQGSAEADEVIKLSVSTLTLTRALAPTLTLTLTLPLTLTLTLTLPLTHTPTLPPPLP